MKGHTHFMHLSHVLAKWNLIMHSKYTINNNPFTTLHPFKKFLLVLRCLGKLAACDLHRYILLWMERPCPAGGG